MRRAPTKVRVNRGFEKLTQHFGNNKWMYDIDQENLDMWRNCILQQLFHTSQNGIFHLFHKKSWKEIGNSLFDLLEDCGFLPDPYNNFDKLHNTLLTNAWRKKLSEEIAHDHPPRC